MRRLGWMPRVLWTPWVLVTLACGTQSVDGASSGGSSATSSGGSASALSGGAPSSGGSAAFSGGSANSSSGGGAKASGGSPEPGTGGAAGNAAGGSGGDGEFTLPPGNAPFDYQIGAPYAPPSGVTVVSRDRESEPAEGLYNICYVNGFQTQPGDNQRWLDESPHLIAKDENGDPILDEDWGEYLLDTGTEEKRQELLRVVEPWIIGCKTAGFDAVEVDNLDSYSRSYGALTEDNNVAFIAMLADVAHEHGLAIGQKNSAELLARRSEMKTDFAVSEECNTWDECDVFQEAYGDLVFIIEYEEADFEEGCQNFPELSIVFRDKDVTAPGSNTYVYDGC
jgi:Glycoside-hydrolase family GH114